MTSGEKPGNQNFFRCRLAVTGEEDGKVSEQLLALSRHLFLTLTETLPEHCRLSYPITRALSGAFVEDYFSGAMRIKKHGSEPETQSCRKPDPGHPL
ncbi:MAG: hypothetical protein P4L42_16875 [Desulfocapsaceae bacterium]|nr:hypothetical protein [Desulfocapsaceae bacterium]